MSTRHPASDLDPKPVLSIIIPVLDEVENLEPLADQIRGALLGTVSYEVILVDDGSTDGSLRTMQDIASRDKRFRVSSLGERCGQSAALAAGLHLAQGTLLATMDADLQNDPADLPTLVDAVRDADLAVGIRVDRRDTWSRRWASKIANRVRRSILGDSIIDTGCSLKVFRAEWLAKLPPFDGLHRFLPAILEAHGAHIVQLPVRHRPRHTGVSKYGIAGRFARGIVDLFGVRWLAARRLGPHPSAQVRRCTTVATSPPSGGRLREA